MPGFQTKIVFSLILKNKSLKKKYIIILITQVNTIASERFVLKEKHEPIRLENASNLMPEIFMRTFLL